MPYRGESGPRIACTAHSSAEAASSCTRCQVPLCDPCTLYFSADPYCRRCVGGVRRAWAARIAGAVAAVVLALAIGSGELLAAVPSQTHRPIPVAFTSPHPE